MTRKIISIEIGLNPDNHYDSGEEETIVNKTMEIIKELAIYINQDRDIVSDISLEFLEQTLENSTNLN